MLVNTSQQLFTKTQNKMKNLFFLSLVILIAACKKEECEPISQTPAPVYTPTLKDSISFIWKLDTIYRTQNNTTTATYPNNEYIAFQGETYLFAQFIGNAVSPYTISHDTIFVDYSIPNVPTRYYKVEEITDNKLILSYASPVSVSVYLRNVYSKQ
jgi:hypothetical protein